MIGHCICHLYAAPQQLSVTSLCLDDTKASTVQIGRDSRLSGPLLLTSVVAGMASQGVSVAQFGLATTPAMFMSCIIPGEAQANTSLRPGRGGRWGVGWGGEVVGHTMHSKLVPMVGGQSIHNLGCNNLCCRMLAAGTG